MGRGSGRGSGGGQAKLAKRNGATSRGAAQTPLSSAAHDSDSAGREDVQDLRASLARAEARATAAQSRADAAEHKLKALHEKAQHEKGVASAAGVADTPAAAREEQAAPSVETVGSEQLAATREENKVPAAEDVSDLRAQNSALQESLAHAEARADAAEHELKVLREKGEEAEKGVASVVGGDSGGAGTAPAASQEEAATSVETVGSEQPVAVTRDEHAVPAAVLEAEDSLLTFWMMRGGGESGDTAVAPWFRPDGAAPRTLDAEQLGAIVREKLNEDLDPAHDEKLHARLLGGSGATTGVLDETAMKAWLRCRFPRFQVNQMLKDFDMRTPVLNQLLGVEPREDGLAHFSSRTKEDVRHALERATSELVDGLYAIIDTVKAGMGQTQGSSVNLKFAGDLGTSGTFEGKYETGKVFDEGLEKYIGLPDPKVFKAILNEHQNAANSGTKFMTSNYGLEVCPRTELEAVLNPEINKTNPVYPGAKGRRQWQNVGTTKPTTGRELSNSKLATELQKKQDFPPEEWDSFGIAEVYQEDFIKAGDSYFKPAEDRHQREIVLFRVFLSAAGCLDEEKWNDPELKAVLVQIQEICGTLDLTPEDQVREAMVLVMQARQGSSETVVMVMQYLEQKKRDNSIRIDMEAFFEAMNEIKHWNRAATEKLIQRGRSLFKLANLRPEEVLCVRMYTGPMFMLYNAVLRKFPQKLIDMMKGTKYVTTVHCINSGIIKLSLATQLLPRNAWRGSNKMKLPLEFAAQDHLGRLGIVEMGFLSLTINKKAAEGYAAGGALSTVLKIMRGDRSSGACIAPLSFYIEEEEVLIPPLAYLERAGNPSVEFTASGHVVNVVPVTITVNQHADTIDGLIERRKFLHKGMVDNLIGEVERELQPLDLLIQTINASSANGGSSANGDSGAPDASGIAALQGTESALVIFCQSARAKCKEVRDKHWNTSVLDFNSDEEFSKLVPEGVDMKAQALQSNTHRKSRLLIDWFYQAARSNGMGLKACVQIVGAQVFAEAPLRYDGATPLALSIVSKNRWAIISFLRPGIELDPQSQEDVHDTTSLTVSDLLRLASAYLQPFNIGKWLQDGVSPLALKGEIGALIATLAVQDETDHGRKVTHSGETVRDDEGPMAEMKLQLGHMRALLDSHAVFLEDPPVPFSHAVVQLAAQEPRLVCKDFKDAKDGHSTPAYDIIEATNHRARAQGFTIQGEKGVNGLAYSNDGKRLARGEGDKVVVCCAESGFEQCQLRGHTDCVRSVCFSPDGTKIASGSEDKTVLVWDAASGEQLCSLTGHTSYVTGVAFHPTKNLVASCSSDNSVKLWNADTGAELWTVSGEKPINCVAFSPDGSLIAAGDGLFGSGEVRIYNASTGDPVGSPLRGHGREVRSVSWSPDGTRLASGSEDKTVLIWDAASGEQLCSLRGHSGTVYCVSFKPDNPNIVVSSSYDETIKTWDITSGSCLSTLRGHTGRVTSVCFSPDGAKIVSGSWDKTVLIWDAASGEQLRSLNVGGPVTAVKFASEGIVASSSTDGLKTEGILRISTKFWDLGTGQETEKTAEEVPEGFTFPKEGGGKEQKVGRYVVAAKGQTLVIHKAPEDKAPEDKAETAADGKADSESESENENESENESESESESESGTQTPVAFFQCASEIAAFDVAGANVAVGCKDGQVLQLRAAVLLT